MTDTRWISKAIKNEGFRKGNINIIFCSDAYLRKMNKRYLQHDYNTDIITFETGDDPSIVLIDARRDNKPSASVA